MNISPFIYIKKNRTCIKPASRNSLHLSAFHCFCPHSLRLLNYFVKPIALFHLEWDAQHLSIKNNVLPFYSYSIKWENIRFIKFTTLYQGKTLLLAGKDYAVKAYIIKALPQKSIKEIYQAMKKPEYLSKTIWIFNKQRRTIVSQNYL